VIQELSRDYFLPEVGGLKVETIAFVGEVVDELGAATPVWVAQGPGGTATAVIDETHHAFTKLGIEPAEMLLMELAAMLKVKADSATSNSQLAARLRAVCLPDTAVDPGVIRSQASELLSDLRQRMSDRVTQDPQRAVSYLDADEQTVTTNALIADGGDSMTATLSDGQFVRYVPPLFLVKLLENWPEAFMDGNVFIGPYASLTAAASKRLSLARVVGYLNDIAILVAFETTPNAAQLRRTRLSIQLLQDELAPDQT
jgi:hypothetical protein